MNLDDPQDRSVAAGEYVLGTLDAEARAAFESRLTGDAALQGEVYAWQDRLVGLTRGVAPADPGPQVWSRIEAGLMQAGGAAGGIVDVAAQGAPGMAAGGAAQRGDDGGTTARDKSASTAADGKAASGTASYGTAASGGATGRAAGGAANDPLWQRLRRWQIASGMAIAAVLVLASLLVLRPPPAAEGERYLAVLQAPDSKTTGWIVEATAGGSVRLVPVGATAAVPPGKVLQFWTKGEREAGPTSLGLIEPGQVTELPADKLPLLEPRQLFELTLEPEGGSPIGRPTGPILFVGSTVRI
ncbi:MAG: anti-sigma factor [Methylibium sp.]|uniref:anti-sigma factor n=1 Tax=Methylibium sp. TaxID=2067992 RepID=UPI0017F145F7|nr:anti-sigma factor [Methylibium sp.]MBA3598013.1 anti-sigma factor [Methylibium sp.]